MQGIENEIDRAKRRVMEMNERADKFGREESPKPSVPVKSGENDDGSLMIILALIVLLSHEKADSKILIALLYLLL